MVKRSTRKGSAGKRGKTKRQKRAGEQSAERFVAKAASQTLPPKPPPAPSGFAHIYGPGILAAHGPLIMAVWSIPQVIEDFLKSNGTPLPAPVKGALLLDTGATGTCISIKAAEALGLKPTRLVDGFGAGGPTKNPIYNARLSISMANPDGTMRVLRWDREVQGIPDLDKHLLGKSLTYAGAQVELTGLLGRDILYFTRFLYDGLAGALKLDFDIAAMGLS